MKLQNNCVKQNSRLIKWSAALGLAALLLGGTQARAVSFLGNGNGGFGGSIGEGTMTLTDDGTNISGTITLGGTVNMNNALVIYIDTGVGGGFSDTSGFNDQADGNRIPISGVQTGEGRSLMTFVSGFAPQYAISLVPDSGVGYGGIWKLADGGNNSLPWMGGVNLSPDNTTGPYTFSFPASDLGLTPGVKTTIKLFGTYISTTGYRSTEALPGNDSGVTQGWVAFTQTTFASYTFDAGAPTLTPVTFQVDMTEQIANGKFNPGNGDTVYASGSFQTNAWTGFLLTNNPAAANTNIYSGTYQDENPTNTAEQYKFYEVSGGTTNYEASDNRLFTLQPGGQTLSLVYFADLSPSPSATTNSVTFQIDMTSAITLGTFTPATESIEVFGTFEFPTQWAAGFILTNNPGGSNIYLYSGTTNDGNYPGSWEQYKYVVVSNGANTYESINNRDFTTPTNAGTLPLAYFNNVNNTVSVPITFQVDMTSQIETGILNLGAGDSVGLGGTFQGAIFAPLTSNPSAANTNVFSGTFVVTAQPGAVIGYKFFEVNSGTTNYEAPASTGTQNRVFVVPSTAETLPLVFWSDEDPNNVLPAATEVTFTVDMTNNAGGYVSDKNGVAFNPATDDVVIAGTFTSPAWVFNWTDAFPAFDTPDSEYILSEVGFSSLYTGTYLVPAGASLQVLYKYGINHNAGSPLPDGGTLDNEAGFAANHTRYIRAVGSYSFPVDIFGQQVTNAAAATEISFGNLTASPSTPGSVALTWLGRPGVFLQVNTNLNSPIWTTYTNSGGGISATNIPTSGGQAFFRLVNP
jgi:hypothetical protein